MPYPEGPRLRVEKKCSEMAQDLREAWNEQDSGVKRTCMQIPLAMLPHREERSPAVGKSYPKAKALSCAVPKQQEVSEMCAARGLGE